MRSGRRHGAARHGIVLLVVAQLLPAVAWADGELQLLLPLVSAMAFGVSAVEATHEATAFHAGSPLAMHPARQRTSLLPRRLLIPDGYALDLEREPRRFAAPVDRDRIVGFDVLSRPRHGWTASMAYDEEDRGPFPGTADVVRFVAEYRF
jgi:hypothetical protein